MSRRGLYLGGHIEPATGERTGAAVDFDPDDLTTHGVIVGMTGSGKTGLGIIYIEEALRKGIPVLVLDPKGDMTNLLLTFPDLQPADFAPWIDELEARRKDTTVDAVAAETADLWRNGLAGWSLGGGDIAALRAAADFTIFTPGSGVGVPLNLIGSLEHPSGEWEGAAEAHRDEIQGFVSGLLGLIGVEADPIASREHILVSNLIEHAWRNGTDLDLETLLAWIQKPPLRKLGVFDVDAFFPADGRMALAMAINGLVASPSFTEWTVGEPLDPGRLLWTDDGRPRASILYLAHLSDDERQFVVTLALSRLVTWMRRQSGTGGLRALVYIDEAFGFVPPVGEPPAKRPILTILKQARAFGIGMLVSTQNPMDLDYKAMSNAGTWNIGRLQTERDKARILEGLSSATGGTDVATYDRLISGLGKRQFVLHSTRTSGPEVFTTRWAMSYLRGPLTGPQITTLTGGGRSEPAPQAETPQASAEPEPADDETRVQPTVAEGIAVRYVDASAPWLSEAGGTPGSTRLVPVLVARLRLRYDETRAGVDHAEEWEAVVPLRRAEFDPDEAVAVDHDARDFSTEPPGGAVYVLTDAPLASKAFFRSAAAALRDHLDRTSTVAIYRNPDLKLYSRVGEARAEFEARCERAAEDRADEDAASLRDTYERKLDTLRERHDAAQRRAEEIEVDVEGAKRTEWTDLAGTVIDFLSGRRSTRRAGSTARRRASVRSKQQRLHSAREKADDLAEAMEELDAELDEELDDISDRWGEKARAIEEMEIGLESDDIDVAEIFVAWMPA